MVALAYVWWFVGFIGIKGKGRKKDEMNLSALIEKSVKLEKYKSARLNHQKIQISRMNHRKIQINLMNDQKKSTNQSDK